MSDCFRLKIFFCLNVHCMNFMCLIFRQHTLSWSSLTHLSVLLYCSPASYTLSVHALTCLPVFKPQCVTSLFHLCTQRKLFSLWNRTIWNRVMFIQGNASLAVLTVTIDTYYNFELNSVYKPCFPWYLHTFMFYR